MDEKLSQSQIDELLKAFSSGDSASITPVAPTRAVKDYDFSNPRKFSNEQLRSLEIIFDGYSRSFSTFMSGYLRSPCDVSVASAEQVIYKEFTNALNNPVIMGMVSFEPLKGSVIMEVSAHIGFAMIDRILGGAGVALKRMRDFSGIEIILLERIINQTLGFLVEPWAKVENINPKLERIETNSQFAQLIAPNETTALVTLEIKLGNVEGFVNFVIPHLVIESRMDRLNTRYWFMQKDLSEKNFGAYGEKLEERLENTNIPIKAIIGKTRLTVGEFASLQVGDIIELDSFVNADMIVTVGDLYKFKGKPGVSKGKNAVKITSLLDEEELTGG